MRPRLFAQVFGMAVRRMMSYRIDFWSQVSLTFLVELAIAYFVWRAIFAHGDAARIGGFTLREMVLYYVFALLLARIVRGRQHDLNISEDIYQGNLTRYLVYPVPYFGFKYAESLGGLVPALIQLAVFGAATLVLTDPGDLGGIGAATVGMTLVSLAVANFLAFLTNYLIQAVSFWADNVWSLSSMLSFTSSLLGGLLLPLSLFPESAQTVLALLPFQYQYSLPVLTLLGKVGPEEWLRGLGIAVVWCGLLAWAARSVWNRGYRTYTGVGI